MSFLDRYFFKPSIWQKLIIFLLLPFSSLYALISIISFKKQKKYNFNIPIISIGNISVGGNGKTPFCKALNDILYPKYQDNIFIILRGYKRKSKGLVLVKFRNQILCDLASSGDEAMEHAIFTKANVIVSEDRVKGIQKALELGAKCVILDDAFSKQNINKFDILLNSKIKYKYNFCLPSGAYRLPKSYEKLANFNAYEDIHFARKSYIKEIKEDMILISAIAKPFRLLVYKDLVKAHYFYNDHAEFNKDEIVNLLKKHNAKHILLSKKDYVKMKDFGLSLVIIDEELIIYDELKNAINDYLKEFDVFNKDN